MTKTQSAAITVGEYRGVTVQLAGGKSKFFTASVGTQKFTGPSWESITGKLDQAIGFEARDVLRIGRDGKNGNIVEKLRIVGREKGGYGWKFITDKGDKISESVYPLEARPHLEKMVRVRKEAEEAKTRYGNQIDALWEILNPMTIKTDASE